ncbi:MAG: hypothetical protein ABIK68_12030 [bacterium]
MILLGWILFAGTHIGLSTQNIRSGLTTRMGGISKIGLLLGIIVAIIVRILHPSV